MQNHGTTMSFATSWSLLGPGVEVGLMPNIMKVLIFLMANVIKKFSYNYDRIIQMLWKKGNKKKIFTLKVFEMMPHGTLKFQIAFWAFRPTSTNYGLKLKCFVWPAGNWTQRPMS